MLMPERKDHVLVVFWPARIDTSVVVAEPQVQQIHDARQDKRIDFSKRNLPSSCYLV